MRNNEVLIKNIVTINSVINQLDDISYKDFLHGIKSEYNRLRVVYDILLKNGLYKKQITEESVLKSLAPNKPAAEADID
jgi:hypothetical protein